MESFTVVGQENAQAFIREYDIEGTKLQQIDLPANPAIAWNTIVPRSDSTRSNVAVVLYAFGTGTTVNNHIYQYNANGNKVYDTIMPVTNSASSSSAMDVAFEGEDFWLTASPNIPYATRGSTSVTTTNIVSGETSFTMAQLVSTKLYVLTNTGIKYMDPVIKSDTSALTALTGISESNVNFFYFYNANDLYYVSQITLYKTTVFDGAASSTYSVSPTRPSGFAINNCYAFEVNGVRYVLVLIIHPSLGSKIQRFRDNNAALLDEKTIFDSSFRMFGVGPSPVPTCSDGLLNQDETDIDCGGVNCGKCATGSVCKANGDCLSDSCNVDGLCVVSCKDGVLNNLESDVDCGGINCSPCANGKICDINSDCSSEYCNPTFNCSVPSCTDGFMNLAETDIDCGGGTCNACEAGRVCAKNIDCASNLCANNVCVNPPVAPVAEPVAAPVDSPIADQTPQSSAPQSTTAPNSSTPTKRKPVSTGSAIEKSIVALLIGCALLF